MLGEKQYEEVRRELARLSELLESLRRKEMVTGKKETELPEMAEPQDWEKPDGKGRYIITFRRKDEREDKKADKTEILDRLVPHLHLNYQDVGALPMGFNLQDDPHGLIALDINDFELPTIFAALDKAEAEELAKDPDVDMVEEDTKIYAQELSFSETPTEGGLFEGLGEAPIPTAAEGPAAQAYVPWGIPRVKAPWCWEATKGKGVYVAVLDTGIWPHDDLKGNLLGGISFVPGQSWVDGNSHGTHCAGTIAARLNRFGVVGVAPSAYLFAIKVLSNSGSGQWSWLMAGLYWMRRYYGSTFDVANISLGARTAPSAVKAYIDYAAQRVLLSCAAGNSGSKVIYPAAYPRALAVSAIDSSNSIAGFSCRGPEIELSAPGVNVVSTLPGNSYGSKSGTSMAAPHVSGAAALCRGTHRGVDMDRIRRLLWKHADNLGTPGKDDLYGYGRVDCYGATFDKTPG